MLSKIIFLMLRMDTLKITCALTTKLSPAEELLSEKNEDMLECVGERARDFVPPIPPILPLWGNGGW